MRKDFRAFYGVLLSIGAALLAILLPAEAAAERFIIVASTTSTQNSGL